MLLDHGEPTNYEEAMMSPDFDKWLEAMKSEIGSMYENDTSILHHVFLLLFMMFLSIIMLFGVILMHFLS